MTCSWKDIAPWSIRLGPGSYFALPFQALSSGSTLFPLSRWTPMSSMESDPPVEVIPAGTIIEFGPYRASPYSRGSAPFPLSANTTVVRSSSWLSTQSLSIKNSTARAGSLVAEVAVTKPFSSSPSPTWIAPVVGSFSEGGGRSKGLSDGRAVSLVRIEECSIRTGSAELRSKGIFVSTQLGLTEGVVTWWLADFLSVCCFTTNVVPTYLWMFPRFWLWGRL